MDYIRIGGFSLFFVAVASWHGGALAKAPVTTVPLIEKTQFRPMKFLLGTWDCTGRTSGNPVAFKERQRWEIGPSRNWIVETITPQNRPAAVGKMTYDSSASKWVFLYTNPRGGYEVWTSAGWNAGKQVWNSRFFGNEKVRNYHDYTIARLSDAEYSVLFSFADTRGRTITVQEQCALRAR